MLKLTCWKRAEKTLVTWHSSLFSSNIKILVISFLVIVPNVSCCPQFFIVCHDGQFCATRYFKAVLIQPKVIKTMKRKSIAYLSLQVILILCRHLYIVFLLKVLITKRTLRQQKNLLLLMLRPLPSHLLRC